jgi:branched-chain amino acid transport system substrate-binding protein
MADGFKSIFAAGLLIFLMLWSPVAAFGQSAVKIALILARTGPAMVSDISGWPVAELAVDRINQNGGLLGHRLELVALDTRSTPIGAITAAKIAVQAGVIAVVGAGWSSQSLPMAKVLQDAGIPMITPSATHPDITRIGDYIFRVCFTDTFQGKALAKFARDDLSAASAVVLRNVSESYSVDLARQFSATYRQLGGKVLWQGDYKTNTADFTAMLRKVDVLQPQVVFVPGYERECGILLRQAGTLGIRACFLGGDGWGHDILRVAGEAADGSYYLTHWHPRMPSPVSQELVYAFQKRYPKADCTSLMVPLTYDAFGLLADAIKRAGSLDRGKIRDALEQTQDYRGATGPLSFDANGDPVSRTAAVLTFEVEKTRFYKTISFP